jgi:threonine dehydrogenase-like Zn-dependent dehydrogenase
MRALHFDGTRARVTDVPPPEPREDSAIVRVNLAGICNTDLELVQGYMDFRGVLGHEFVGVVDEGPAEWHGQRVVGEISFACQNCDMCQANLQRHCPSRRVMGIHDADGAFAEFVRVPVANLHMVPDSVPDDVAVFTEPLASACEILTQVEVEPDVRCVVLGDGKLGLLVAQVLDAAGANVLVVGNHAEKLDILKRRGIRTSLTVDWTPEPTPLVVDATGSAQGFERALATTKPQGTLVLKSTVAERRAIDLAPVVINEIRVVGSRCGPFPPALGALEAQTVDVRPLITERVPLRNADEGLRRAAEANRLKILIEP